MYQFGSQCFNTKAQANAARASAESGQILENGGQATLVTATLIKDDSVTYKLQPLNGGTATIIEVPQEPFECLLLTAEDGYLIGSSIAAGWFIIYGILSLLDARTKDDT